MIYFTIGITILEITLYILLKDIHKMLVFNSIIFLATGFLTIIGSYILKSMARTYSSRLNLSTLAAFFATKLNSNAILWIIIGSALLLLSIYMKKRTNK